MKIAIVADKKSGDLSHCLGLRDVLQDYDPKKDIFYLHKDLISFPGFLERSLRLINEKFNLIFISDEHLINYNKLKKIVEERLGNNPLIDLKISACLECLILVWNPTMLNKVPSLFSFLN